MEQIFEIEYLLFNLTKVFFSQIESATLSTYHIVNVPLILKTRKHIYNALHISMQKKIKQNYQNKALHCP